MTGMQITLLVLGGVIFIISFFLPAGKKSRNGGNGENDLASLTDDHVKVMVEKEIDDSKSNINDIIDETVTYAMEKGERAMERITNEKIMAINEYSDTVLKEIHKNQQEVVFLYDMLNDKHSALMNTVNQATSVTSEMKQANADAGGTPETAKRGTAAKAKKAAKASENEAEDAKPFQLFMPQKINSDDLRILNKPYPEIQETADNASAGNSGKGGSNRNSNDIILEMHKEGKTNMAIARTLGLGISEVKLVIDLFED